jgi:hypothetical protein
MSKANPASELKPLIKYRKYFPEIFVSAASFAYSIYMLSWNFINPFSSNWLYGKQAATRDDAGHAIGSLFYMNEHWAWPIGKFTSFGGQVSPSVVYWAISPIFAVPAKVLHKIGLVGDNFQFIGLQVLIGFVLTPVSVYLLSRRLGSGIFPAITVSLSTLLFPTLLWRWENESLASQFIVVFGILLLLRPTSSAKRTWQWAGLTAVAVGTNSYFVPITLTFCVIEFFVLQKSNRKELKKNVRSLSASILTTIALQYAFGGFLISTFQLGTGAEGLTVFSGNLFSLVDSRQYGLLGGKPTESWEGFNYLGLATTTFLIIFMILHARNIKKKENIYRTPEFKYVMLVSALFYLYSLGPDLKFGSILHFDLTPYLPEKVIVLLSIFRALGRFQWPLYYMLVALSGVGITYFIEYISDKRNKKFTTQLTALVCSVFLMTCAADMHYFNSAMRSEARDESGFKSIVNPGLQAQFDAARGIQVVPAYDGNTDGLLPWRYLSPYVLRANLNFDSWAFYARYDFPKAAKIQSTEYADFIACNWKDKVLYLTKSDILSQLKCDFKINKLYYDGPWVLIKKEIDQ